MASKGKGSPLYLGVAIGVLLAALIAIVAVIGVQMTSLTRRLDSRGQTLMSSVRDNTAALATLTQGLRLLARDSNETRAAVHLPTRDYPLPHATAQRPDRSDPADPFLNGLDLLLRTADRRAARQRIDRVAASAGLRQIERDLRLSADRGSDDRLALVRGGHNYFTLAVDPVSGALHITDALGEGLTAAAVDRSVAGFLARRSELLDRHFERLEADLRSLRGAAALPAVVEIARANELTISALEPVDGGYRMLVRRAGETLLTVSLDPVSLAVTAGNRRYGSVAAFRAAFPGELRAFDPAAAARERVSAARRRIEALRGNKTFMLALSARGITFAATPREEIDYFSYDFTDSSGVRVGSFAVQKKLGTIYLMDGNGLTIRGLTSVDAGAGGITGVDGLLHADPPPAGRGKAGAAARRPGATGRARGKHEATDFLICGAHQKETDAIMVVHADRSRGEITLFGLPRDLYYKGRKINAVYERYGPRELAREAAEITGLPIHNYVVIDMYAFIDVVNILGGIDLFLDAPLVDPTYRIWERDGWSTLSYAAGMHHLDGIAALRVARSRNTSSDFVRAYRQQDILAAIRRRLDGIDPLDLSTLSNLAGVFFRHVDTDFTPSQLVTLLLTYRDLPIAGNYVLDTENVLYQTYTNIYYLEDNGKQPSGGLDKGAWILLPRDDDWSVIRRYVHGILGGDV